MLAFKVLINLPGYIVNVLSVSLEVFISMGMGMIQSDPPKCANVAIDYLYSYQGGH